MKFFSNTLYLLINAIALTGSTKANLMIREEGVSDPSSLPIECQKSLTESLEPCINKDITKNNIDNICTLFKSEKCQKLFNQEITSFEGCESLKGEEDIVSSINKILNVYTSQLELICEKDENGKSCQLGELLINNSILPSNTTELEDTCQSKKCIDLSIKVYSSYESLRSINQNLDLNPIYDMIPNSMDPDKDDNNKMLTFLTSDNCTSQDQSSDAITSAEITISSALIGILCILLYLF